MLQRWVMAALVCLGCDCGPRVVQGGDIEVTPGSLDFESIVPGTAVTGTVRVQNKATYAVHLAVAVVEARRSDAFSVTAPALVVEPGASLELSVSYRAATVASADVASLSVTNLDSSIERRVALAGSTHPFSVDAGTSGDGGVVDPDAGTPDAGAVDAGTPDAGGVDAGTPDAGSVDAGPPDAGVIDAGTPDAGVVDAGTFDAGTFDAGTFDAGTFDAGVAVDSGSPDSGVFDAGLRDAGLELPVFDGGGTCGNTNVIDLRLPTIEGWATDPSVVADDAGFAFVWMGAFPDGGPGVRFAHTTPAGTFVGAPTDVIAGQGRAARLGWNGVEYGLAWDRENPASVADAFVFFGRLDLQGRLVPGTTVPLGSRYRPGMTSEAVAWSARARRWVLSWGWRSVGDVASVAAIDGGAAGAPVDFAGEVAWRSNYFVAGADGGFAVFNGTTPAVLHRLDEGLGEVWSASVSPWVAGSDLEVVASPHGFGLTWVHSSGSTGTGVWFAFVDADGTLTVSPRQVSAGGSAIGSGPAMAWNGTSFTIVFNEGVGSQRPITEVRVTEAGQVGPRRQLTCSGQNLERPSIAWGHGVHFVTYGDSTSLRLLLFP